jgi:ABC-2 type transport system ATP-binding protein
VVIVSHGRLVCAAPLDELTARLAGTVRVEADRPAALELALRNAQAGVIERDGGTLRVHGASAEKVGAIARAADVGLSELVTESASLEDVFLELTAGGSA